jgi:hypothetical protein
MARVTTTNTTSTRGAKVNDERRGSLADALGGADDEEDRTPGTRRRRGLSALLGLGWSRGLRPVGSGEDAALDEHEHEHDLDDE